MQIYDDVKLVEDYFYNKYSVKVSVCIIAKHDVSRDDPRLIKWASIISKYFNVSESFLFSSGRGNNSYEKIWFRYFLIVVEKIPMTRLIKALGVGDHSTLIASKKRCQGFIDVYPWIYEDLIKLGKEYKEDIPYDYQIQINPK